MELDGVPNIGSDELNDARDTAIELQLTNRFAQVEGKFRDDVLLCAADHEVRYTSVGESTVGEREASRAHDSPSSTCNGPR